MILPRMNKEHFDRISYYFRVTKYILPLQGNAVTAIELIHYFVAYNILVLENYGVQNSPLEVFW